MKTVYRTRLANLTEQVLGRSRIAPPSPLFVLHSPQLPVTPPEEIENARATGRPIYHIRFVRAEDGRLAVKRKKEEPPYVEWSRLEDAPNTPTETYLIDDNGSVERTTSMEPAQDGAGCNVPESE